MKCPPGTMPLMTTAQAIELIRWRELLDSGDDPTEGVLVTREACQELRRVLLDLLRLYTRSVLRKSKCLEEDDLRERPDPRQLYHLGAPDDLATLDEPPLPPVEGLAQDRPVEWA